MTFVDPSHFQPTPVFRARRRRTLVRVQIYDAEGNLLDAMVQDISASGLSAIARQTPPARDDIVTLDLPDGQVLWGLVRWVDGKAFGIEFDTGGGQMAGEPAQKLTDKLV